MFTALSANTRRSDLGERKRLHTQLLRARLRQLRRRVRHEIYMEREKALIYRLLARRFTPDSPHRSLLRILARSGIRRIRRLEEVLHELHGATASQLHKGYSVRWKCWFALHAPRKWVILGLKSFRSLVVVSGLVGACLPASILLSRVGLKC
jgi:hypothetical protein